MFLTDQTTCFLSMSSDSFAGARPAPARRMPHARQQRGRTAALAEDRRLDGAIACVTVSRQLGTLPLRGLTP